MMKRKKTKLNIVLILVLILITNPFVHGQIINSQNEIQNGKKKGLWIEYYYMSSIDLNGERALLWKQKSKPKF